jgi:dihydrodipicolinate reductase
MTGEEEEKNVVSLRGGDELGQHTVYLSGPGERIEVKHQCTRREVFQRPLCAGGLENGPMGCPTRKGIISGIII